MKQRTAILLAFALTAFVLVVVGAIAFTFTVKTIPQNQELEPAIVENVRGEVHISAPRAPTAAPIIVLPTPLPTKIPATAQPQILSPTRATQLALAIVRGGKLASQPELVNYKGKMAYEVILSGSYVYVDAFTGRVLGSVIAVASNQPSVSQETGGNTDSGGSDQGGGDGNTEQLPPPTNAPAPTDIPNDPMPPNPPSQHDDDDNDDDSDRDDGDHDNSDDNNADDQDDGGANQHDDQNQNDKHNDKHQDNSGPQGDDDRGDHEGDD